MHFYHDSLDIPAAVLFANTGDARLYTDGLIDGLLIAFEALGLADDPDHKEMLAGLIGEAEEDCEQDIRAIERHN